MLKNFFFTTLIFLLSAGLFYFSITQLDPLGEQANISLIVFYISLFFGVSSFFTLVFFFINEVFSRENLWEKHFFMAIRRGILTGTFVSIVSGFQMLRILGAIEIILVFLFLVIMEMIFLSVGNK